MKINNNSKAAAKRTQIVRSEPEFVKIGTKKVTSKKGLTHEVGVYRRNKNSKPLKAIVHPLLPGDSKTKAFYQFNKFKNR